MGFEITTHTTVGPNGHIEVDLPELVEGQQVRLVVSAKSLDSKKESRGGFGSMRGELLYMSDDFDEPLGEFDKYQ